MLVVGEGNGLEGASALLQVVWLRDRSHAAILILLTDIFVDSCLVCFAFFYFALLRSALFRCAFLIFFNFYFCLYCFFRLAAGSAVRGARRARGCVC